GVRMGAGVAPAVTATRSRSSSFAIANAPTRSTKKSVTSAALRIEPHQAHEDPADAEDRAGPQHERAEHDADASRHERDDRRDRDPEDRGQADQVAAGQQ